ncbi:hypothetical protein N0V93_002614 [Gnomoniopsis smithogilvyi]|uniref:Amidohydrolase-related domain-containing protein n=1 Tax=Gnomoniopsis smithogilvyi TaxID=1191159 RepID=A0A9W9CZC3_9PEZI|nr:hypothetical protein N0V93_002614 [Gnomoniopsis smithogilvyi]
MQLTSIPILVISSSLCLGAPLPQTPPPSLSFITLEEHYVPPSLVPLQAQDSSSQVGGAGGNATVPGSTTQLIQTLDQARVDDLTTNGIAVQVISPNPVRLGLSQPATVRQANDETATAISQFPDRFRAFAFLPMADPLAAAAELERSVTQLEFVGALVDSHLPNQTYYDDAAWDPFWATAQRLDVPIYLHPTYADIEDITGLNGRFSPEDQDFSTAAAAALAGGGFGWHVDTGLQFLRLWIGGVFDRFPDLKIVIGHMGETIPFMLQRTNRSAGGAKPEGVTVVEAYAKNLWITTSGFFDLEPFSTVLSLTSNDHILYSVDYPFSTNAQGAVFMQSLRNSGCVTEEEWDNIAYNNAASLLKIN